MTNISSKAYKRNFGFWNEDEQHCLSNAKVAIAGVGGDGFQLGIKLAMMGVKNFRVADPETFEEENSNRVFGARSSTYGRNKAEVFKEMAMDIRPDAIVEVFSDGLTEKNSDRFIDGVDLILDESELTRLDIGTLIARKARAKNIPVLFVMNIGFASIATVFNPKPAFYQSTFEEVMGVPEGASYKDIKKMKVDFSRCLPYIPSYGDINVLSEINNGAPLPSISQGVDIASALGATEAFLLLTSKIPNHRKKPTWAPKFRYMDSYTGNGGTIRLPKLSYYIRLFIVFFRSICGLNPKASYSKRDRDARD